MLGVRYTSPTLSCGAIAAFQPTQALLHTGWLVRQDFPANSVPCNYEQLFAFLQPGAR